MPFILIGLSMIGAACVVLGGRLEVRIRGEHGAVFIGCGPVGWTRRFNALRVRDLEAGQARWKQKDQARPVIVLKSGEQTIRFSPGLPAHGRE